MVKQDSNHNQTMTEYLGAPRYIFKYPECDTFSFIEYIFKYPECDTFSFIECVKGN